MNILVRWLGYVGVILVLPWVAAAAQETSTPLAEPTKAPAAKEVKAAPPPVDSKSEAKQEPKSESKSEPKAALLGLNSASEKELSKLPGLTAEDVKRIVKDRKDRPYNDKEDLIDRKVLSSKTYENIKALVVADPVTKPTAK